MKKTIRTLFVMLLTTACVFGAAPLSAQAFTLTSGTFNSKRYADEYCDLRAAFGYNHDALWQHYVNFGMKEGRAAYSTDGERATGTTAQAAATVPAGGILTSENFDSVRYANDYRDLRCAFGYDHGALWNHYLTFGKREGRIVYNRAGQRAEAADAALLPAAPTPEQMFANAMLSHINATRARYGAPALELAEDCMAAAAVRGNDFKQYLSQGAAVTALPHIRPDGSLFTTAYCCRRGQRYGENTYFTYFFTDDDILSFASRTHLAMSESSDHYLRMVNPNFRYAGFSFIRLADEGQSSWYVVLEEFRD